MLTADEETVLAPYLEDDDEGATPFGPTQGPPEPGRPEPNPRPDPCEPIQLSD